MQTKVKAPKERFFKKQLLEVRNSSDDKKEKKKHWYLLPQNIITGILPLILSLVAILQTSVISKQQQRIEGIDSLLRNSNNLNILISAQLTNLDSQLSINALMQANSNKINENSNVGNMNKYAAAIYSLGDVLTAYKEQQGMNMEAEENLISQAKLILDSQMNNPYLVQNAAAMKHWVDAYRHTYFFKRAGFNGDFSDDFAKVSSTRLIEITKSVNSDFNSALNAINLAYRSGIEYLKRDKNFLK